LKKKTYEFWFVLDLMDNLGQSYIDALPDYLCTVGI